MPTERPDGVSPAANPGPRSSRWLIVLVAVTLALRITIQMVRVDDLRTDPDAYVAHAVTLQDSGRFAVPGTDRPTAFRPPAYPVLLATFLCLGCSTTVAVAVINLLASVAMVIGTWWLARVIGLRGLWPTLCGALVVFDPLLLRYAALPMTETVAGGFLTIGLLLALKGISEEQDPTPRWKSAVASGFCFGIGGLTRPILLIACAALSAGLLLHWWRRRPQCAVSTRASLCAVFLPALVAGAVLSLWVTRNAVQFGHFVPATTHGGYTLLLGNNPVFYRDVVNGDSRVWGDASLRQWQHDIEAQLTADGIATTDECGRDATLYEWASAAIKEDPTSFRRACLLRWRRFWAVRPESTSDGSTGIAGWITSVWYVLVFAGLIVAVAAMLIRRDSRLLLVFLPIPAFFAMHTVYWTNARMRAPLSAVIAILSAYGWRLVVQRRSSRDQHDSTAAGQNHTRTDLNSGGIST